VLHDINQLKGKLFKDALRTRNLAQIKIDFDAYHKRIGFAALAPVAFDALMIKVVRVYKEPKLAAWGCACAWHKKPKLAAWGCACAARAFRASGRPRLRKLRSHRASHLDSCAPGWARRRRCRSRTSR
jgi:hypothetical protein